MRARMLFGGVLLVLGGCFNPGAGDDETGATTATSATTSEPATMDAPTTIDAPTTGPAPSSTGEATGSTGATDPAETTETGETTTTTTTGAEFEAVFMAPIDTPVSGAYAVITARLDDDPRADLAVLSSDMAGGLYRIPGSALGSMPTPFVTGRSSSLAGAPFNGDTFTDVVLSATDPPTMGVVTTNGAGEFMGLTSLAIEGCAKPMGVALADPNSDGNVDAAVACGGQLFYYYAAGLDGGMFAAPVQRPLDAPAVQLVFVDMVGDEKLDLVTVTESGVYALPGNGMGGFDKSMGLFTTITEPASVTVGDVDDAFTDLVFAGETGICTILFGSGNGALGEAREVVCGQSATTVAIADVTNDGAPDLVAADLGGGAMVVAANAGDETFMTTQAFPVPDKPYGIAVGDYDGMLGTDVAVACESGTVRVFLNAG